MTFQTFMQFMFLGLMFLAIVAAAIRFWFIEKRRHLKQVMEITEKGE